MKKKHTLYFLFIFYTLVILNTSCKKVDVNFGNEFVDNGNTEIFKVDTFGVELSTVFLDSFATNGINAVMIGGYNDPIFGRINTQSYAQIAPPPYENIYANTIFDSLVLILKPNGNFYGDSTMPINIKMHELSENITIPDGGVFIHNNKSFNVNPTLLVDETIRVRPQASNNEITIKLSNTLGLNWLNKLKNPTDADMKTPEDFIKYFKGVRLSSNSASQMIFNCAENITLRLYYKKPDVVLIDKFVDFALINKQFQFNNISIVRSGTILQAASPTNKEIPSSLTNNASYTQGATGSMTKLRFPNIREILKLPNFAKIVKVNLTVRPLKNSYNSTFFLPPAMKMASTNAQNTIGPELAFVNGDGSLGVQLGNLQTDYYLGENTTYTYDLTQYVRSILPDPTSEINKNGLLFIPQSPAFETQFSRVVIGDRNNMQGRIGLEIYYISVK